MAKAFFVKVVRLVGRIEPISPIGFIKFIEVDNKRLKILILISMDLKLAEEKLRKTKEELEKELANLKGVPEMGTDVESDSYDQETDEAEEYSNMLALREDLKNRLVNVEKALDKIANGTFGKCDKCDKTIPEKILAVNPESNYCKEACRS